MSEFINRDEVIDELANAHLIGDDYCDYLSFLGILNSLPAADVAEVVHCKDCIYADKYSHCGKVIFWNTPDDYCSRGVRRAVKVVEG